MLAVGDGGLDQAPGDPVAAADQLHHHVDLGIAGQRQRIVAPAQLRDVDATVALALACRDCAHHNRPAATLRQYVPMLLQQPQGARTNGTQPGDPDPQCAAHMKSRHEVSTGCLAPKDEADLQEFSSPSVTPARAGVHIPEAGVYGPRLSPG